MKSYDRGLLDSSVLVALLVSEKGSVAAAHMVNRLAELPFISDFAAGEFASAISIKVCTGELHRTDGVSAFADFDDWMATSAQSVALDPSDVHAATALVRQIDLKLRLPDAIHLAIARRLGAVLLTFDRQQAIAASAIGLTVVPPEA